MATRIKMGAAALPEHVHPSLVLAHAEAWIGTPYVPRGAIRAAGADCVGLLRGLHAELCGSAVPAPPWSAGAAVAEDQPIARELAARMVPMGPDYWHRGDVVVLRVGRARAAHAAVYVGGGHFIHSAEAGGVMKVPGLNMGRPVTSEWGFPCPPGCVTGPTHLTAADCVVVVYPHPAGAVGEITYGMDGTRLARTAPLPTEADVVDLLAPIYPHIETVR